MNVNDLPPPPKRKKAPNRKTSLTGRDTYKTPKKEVSGTELKKIEKRAKAYKPDVANVIDTEVLKFSKSEQAKEAQDRKVIWQPHNGVQTEFLASDEDEVLFSGGRGSGKSAALMVDPLRYCHKKTFRALIVRRTMPELRSLISEAKELYFQAFPGVRWKEQEKMFVFPSGATIEFGYCDNIDDVERYRGQQYAWLGIDELTHFDSPEIYNKLKGSLRTTDPTQKVYVRCTTNPNGKGKWWVREYFIDNAPSGKTFTLEFDTPIGKLRITRKWFNSTVMDNPTILQNNPQYIATLASYPEALRKQWLEGSWDAVEGMAFPDFSTSIHVIDPFKIPHSWLKFRGCDWGYASRAACVWLAVDQDNNIYVYREFGANGPVKTNTFLQQPKLTADLFAQEVVKREAEDNVKYGVLDASTWAHRGDSGPSIAEEMILNGCLWRPSDRHAGSRKSAVLKMHQLLKVDEHTGRPKIFIFNTCPELIKCLSSLPLDENDPEDVDTTADDHFWDALMYGLMSRPNLANGYDDWLSKSMDTKPVIINNTFGY